MQWKFTPGIIILALMLFAAFPASSQVTTDTIPQTTDTVAPVTTTDTIPPVTTTDTVPTSIDPQLLELTNSKVPREYTLGKIKITGTKYLDEQLLISISGLTTGDKLTIPGGDNFSKAINNLWRQNLFSNVQIFFTNVSNGVVDLEINVTERPRLSNFTFKGVRKSDVEELTKKSGLVKGRVVTENTKISAVQAIQKFYTEKGFQSAEVRVNEVPDPSKTNTVTVVFNVNRGAKVRINEVNFYGNQNVTELKLKKQMKGTKEMTKITIHPSDVTSTYGENTKQSFKDYVKDLGFLSITKTKEYLDPYFRFKLFSSAKFNETKYTEDKEKVVAYYNSLGFRDASIIADTHYINNRGSLNVDLKINEGNRYYFGDITWRGNTKYSDSVLNLILGIKKGDIYNAKTLNTKLGKEVTAEGGDISNLYQDDGYLFFAVDPIETAVYNDTIDYEIRLREGPQATIKNITISGNEKTKEHVIRREIRTLPGAKFSRSDLIRSNREIAQLGYFNQEKIGINPVPNPDDGPSKAIALSPQAVAPRGSSSSSTSALARKGTAPRSADAMRRTGGPATPPAQGQLGTARPGPPGAEDRRGPQVDGPIPRERPAQDPLGRGDPAEQAPDLPAGGTQGLDPRSGGGPVLGRDHDGRSALGRVVAGLVPQARQERDPRQDPDREPVPQAGPPADRLPRHAEQRRPGREVQRGRAAQLLGERPEDRLIQHRFGRGRARDGLRGGGVGEVRLRAHRPGGRRGRRASGGA